MSKFNTKRVMPRFSVFAILMTMTATAVMGRMAYIMTAKRDYWMKVAEQVKKDSVSVKPKRGNILSANGQLMASSLPEFKMFIDFKAMHQSQMDTLWEEKLDTICMELHKIFPSKTAEEFKAHLEEGRQQLKPHWPVWKRRVDFNTLCQVRELPVFNCKFNSERVLGEYISRSSYASGFHIEEYNSRQRPYGSLAGRTVGTMYGAIDKARFGLELSYDSILRGTNGIIHRRKVLDRFLDIMDTPPVDGADIVTTIDVGMQDLAERAVIDELKEIDGNVGVAIVMEVATGDVKAIVNMEKCKVGEEITYRELKNHAVSDLLEPGSVFKTASLMVTLDDGMCDTTKRVETGGGVWPMYGRNMKDHNWHRGGYGTLTFSQTLHFSSNIGVSRIVDEYYHNKPEKFVEGIYRTGLADDLRIPLKGSSAARIRMPKKDKTGRYWSNWSNTALPWMSIGYETQIPPISTLTFYNAIANNGRMMRPRFVSKVVKDGEVVMEFPPEVMREHIAKPATIKTMQTMLEHVVTAGTGKKAGSTAFRVAGKTGTAQIWTASGKTTSYLLSFAGFFPADAPRYSCIVCIQKSGTPASGGMSALVFHNIAEGIMARDLKLDVNDARDAASILVPDVKNGNLLATNEVLNYLGVKFQSAWAPTNATSAPAWGTCHRCGADKVELTKSQGCDLKHIPDVMGMGARDAVYLMEQRGVKARIIGRGKVVKQSLQPGTAVKKEQQCILTLSI